MTEVETSRRALIKSAVAGAALCGPLALLAGCSGDAAPGNLLSVVPAKPATSFGATAIAAGSAEVDYWKTAVGQTFKITGPEGPMYAILSAVTPLPIEGDRPSDLRPQPMAATFTLDRGYRPIGDVLYAMVQGREAETQLFLQRGGTVEAPTLTAQFN